jgi:hypothetical protein
MPPLRLLHFTLSNCNWRRKRQAIPNLREKLLIATLTSHWQCVLAGRKQFRGIRVFPYEQIRRSSRTSSFNCLLDHIQQEMYTSLVTKACRCLESTAVVMPTDVDVGPLSIRNCINSMSPVAASICSNSPGRLSVARISGRDKGRTLMTVPGPDESMSCNATILNSPIMMLCRSFHLEARLTS